MGTISERARADGSRAYTAQIRLKRSGAVVHTEAQTFDRRPAAAAWLKRREAELAVPGALDRAQVEDPTLGQVIDRYTTESVRKIGRTKTQVLRAIKGYDIADLACSRISSADITAFARQIKAQPQTVGNYMSHLASVFAIARPLWGYPLDQQAMKDALAVTRRVGITSKSRQRDRRPTRADLDTLLTHFAARQAQRPSSVPMVQVVAFAIFSTRRTEEIARITWADLDVEGSRILVRDMKNPGETIGNDVYCDLPPEALRIIQAMPRRAPRIFPYTRHAIGAAFTRAAALLGIADLHFHDLRHDGVSRLFELGWTIPRVAAVSGHRSWSSLKRYTHLRQTGDAYAGWPWLDVACSSADPPDDISQRARLLART